MILERSLLQALALVLTSLAVHADFTVTGTFEYVDRPFSYSGGFSASESQLPVRLARVRVVDDASGSVLAFGPTDENGDYSILVPGSGTSDIVVRCYAQSFNFGSKQLRVTDTSNTVYSTSSQVFDDWNLDDDLTVGTVVALKLTSSGDQGGPFNMLDQLVAGMQYIKSLGASNPSQTIRMQWPGGSGSYASGALANMSTDDGFDDMVQLHELGHVIHNLYSDSDSPGGSHSFAQSDQDPRLSWGEGWATYFAAAVRQFHGILDPAIYLDCDGDGDTGSSSIQLRLRMENGSPYGSSIGGEADESAVAAAMWDVIDTTATNDTSAGSDDDLIDGSGVFNGGLTGDQVVWNAFVGPVASASNLTVRDVFHGFFSPSDGGGYTELAAVFDRWKMHFTLDDIEPNQSVETASPFSPSSSWGSTRTLYYSAGNPPAPGDGDSDHYSFFLADTATFEVETRYPGGVSDAQTYADTYLVVRRPDGSILTQADSGGTGRNAKLANLTADATGTWTVEVSSVHSYRKTGSYQMRVRILSSPPVPTTIAAVSPASVDAVTVDDSVTVTLSGTGFLDVTGVSVDGTALTKFPAQYTIQDDATLSFTMPLVTAIGAVPIDLSHSTGTASSSILVLANEPPVLDLQNSDPLFLFSSIGAQVALGGSPGDTFFLLVSPDLSPTQLPGLFDLDIGGGATSLLLLSTTVLPASARVDLSLPFSGIPAGTQFHFQALRFAGSLPLDSTNVQTGTVFF